MRSTIRLASCAGFVLATAVLTACSAPPWQDPTLEPHSAHVASRVVPAAMPSDTPSADPVVNDLVTGVAVRTLTAGDVTLTAQYWSTTSAATEQASEWNAAAPHALTISASAALGTDTGQSVYLSRITVTPAFAAAKGTPSTAEQLVDAATVSPGYLVKAPFSYSQSFTIPAGPANARTLTLDVTYELLLQAAPGSGEFAKQTATDRVTIALTSQPGAANARSVSTSD